MDDQTTETAAPTSTPQGTSAGEPTGASAGSPAGSATTTGTPVDHPAGHPSPAGLAAATVAVTSGRPERTRGGPVNPPVVLSSTYVSTGTPPPGELLYARSGTETWVPFERALADLEGADQPALVYSSGMAAIAAALSLVPVGGRLVVPRHAYQVTLGFADDLAARAGVEVVRVDIADTDAVVAAVRAAPTSLLWVESPTNPMLEVADLPALVEAAHAAGVPVAVDNTFATPLGQRPLGRGRRRRRALGDEVPRRAQRRRPRRRRRRRRRRCATRFLAYRTLHGAIAGPWEVWLALRGLRTLALRVERSPGERGRARPAAREHPGVAEVRHPSLPDDPGHARAAAAHDRLRLDHRPASRRGRRGRRRRRGRAARCGSRRRASAASSRASSGGAGSRPSPRRSPRTCCGCRSASRTSRTCGPTSPRPSTPVAGRA